MAEWKPTRLGDHISLKGGLSYKGEFIDKGDAVLVGMGCVSHTERFLTQGGRRYGGEFAESHRVRPGDLVIATRQQSDNLPILGFPAMIPDQLQGRDVVVATNLYKVFNDSDIDNRFLYWLLRGTAYRERILGCAKGTTVRMLTKDAIEDFQFFCPPPHERNAITSILDSLEDKIELNRRMNATLEAMARALFQSWFVDFDPVRAKLDERKPASLDEATAALFPGTFRESSIGHIPSGWTVGSLADLMDIQGGTQPPASEFLFTPRDGYVRLVQIRDYESESHLTFVRDTSKLRKCRRNDVMIARYGASVARICWGLEGAYNVALVKAAPRKPCFREFLRSYLQYHDFQARLIGMSNRSVQAGFNKGDIASFQVAIPPDELLEKYHATAWELRKRILHNKDGSRALATLRDALLPKLLSGTFLVKPTLVPCL